MFDIKVKIKKVGDGILPAISKKGDWLDLYANETITMEAPQAGTLKKHTVDGTTVSHRDVSFNSYLIPLGVAMKLPKGYEAIIAPRSSSFKNFGIMQTNGIGVVDNSYCGNDDEWKMPVIALRDTTISKGDRVCQFRLQLSQGASIWQKIKWVLSNCLHFIEVKNLKSKNRGGFGSTGK